MTLIFKVLSLFRVISRNSIAQKTNVLALFLFFCVFMTQNTHAQNKGTKDELPVIKSNVSSVSILDGSEFKKNGWNLVPEAKPDIYDVGLLEGKPQKVTFYTDIDSISFTVDLGKSYDFMIDWNGKMCHQRLVGKKYVPAAVFNEDYIKKRKGKIFINIPEVYELVNVAMAITSFGKNNKNFIYQKSKYYQGVLDWFDAYGENEFVETLDSILSLNSGYYASLKMNGYAFVFDESGKIKRSEIFDRTGFSEQKTNMLLPYMEQMQSFADESNFLEFYQQNSDIYSNQINFYKDSINIPEMQTWLENNFPGSNNYDTYNIIFSPLVAYNQSTTWFESNGFKELQPHVNFPYKQDFKSLSPISQEAEFTYRGNIVFTEINHGYINPEGEKYGSMVYEAVSNRNTWVDSSKSANNYSGARIFHEYMNWGLISLRIVDYVDENEQEKLINRTEQIMENGRGFLKFKAFNQFLVELYKNRKKGSTIADLYPEIITWFEKNN